MPRTALQHEDKEWNLGKDGIQEERMVAKESEPRSPDWTEGKEKEQTWEAKSCNREESKVIAARGQWSQAGFSLGGTCFSLES